MPLPRVGLEERGTPMLDARTARILAKENEEDIEARRRREMVERCEKNIEKAVNEGRLDAVLFVGGLDDAKREALEVMRGRGWRGNFIPSDSPEASPSPSNHGCAHDSTAHAMENGGK